MGKFTYVEWKGLDAPYHSSRAHNPKDLSRDGMCTVLEIGLLLLAVCESVDTSSPHRGVVRSVWSEDRGLTWSWASRERQIVYQPANHSFNALSPWLGMLGSSVICFFASDEHESSPGIPSQGVQSLELSIEYVISIDNGSHWGPSHRMPTAGRFGYSPGVVALTSAELVGTFLAYCAPIDFFTFSARRSFQDDLGLKSTTTQQQVLSDASLFFN